MTNEPELVETINRVVGNAIERSSNSIEVALRLDDDPDRIFSLIKIITKLQEDLLMTKHLAEIDTVRRKQYLIINYEKK